MTTPISESFRTALEPVLLSLADDELVIGHRHSEWTGWAPHIEEDIAFSSIAQDEIGHAALFYRLLSDVVGRSTDELALGRQPSEYRNAIICERPNRDWAFTIARQFLYETADRIRLESLRTSTFKPLTEAVEKILREERYHQLHADAWFRRMSGGPIDARQEFAAALSVALPECAGIFEKLENETEALEAGIWPSPSEELSKMWLDQVMERIGSVGFQLPSANGSDEDGWTISSDSSGFGGRHGRHSEDFESLWDDLTKTYREEPSATW